MPPVPPVHRRARRAPVLVAAAVLAAAVASGWVRPHPVGAQESSEPIVIDDPRLDPSLAGVQVSGDGYQKALGAYRAAAAHLADAEARLARATQEVDDLTLRRDTLQADLADARQRGDRAREELARHQASLRAVAVASYVQGPESGAETLIGGVEQAAVASRQDAMVRDVTERRTMQVREAKAAIRDADGAADAATASLSDVEARLEAAAEVVETTTPEADRLRTSAAAARQSLADWRLSADVAGSDLPLVALDAYVKAAARMAVERPGCGLRWSGLAGIGKVESGHGTYGGSRLSARGDTSQPIVGIPLDGSNGTAVVDDTDGGELDGDATTDRAVGPMQFIPGSWRALGRDGNGDGRADPSNIYDAALAAAGLLCRAAGSGLDTDAGLNRAALSYNNSASYASLVVRTANGYAARQDQLIPPPPTTTTTLPDQAAGGSPSAAEEGAATTVPAAEAAGDPP